MKKNIDQLLNKYMKVLDLKDSLDLMEYSLKGHKYIEISEDEIKKLDILLQKKKEQEKRLFKTAALNNKGIAFEKSGNINKAIKCYEENLLIGYPARHSFDRLMIIYRKLKDYDNELRVIEKAIDLFREEKYSQRLAKLKKSRK